MAALAGKAGFQGAKLLTREATAQEILGFLDSAARELHKAKIVKLCGVTKQFVSQYSSGPPAG